MSGLCSRESQTAAVKRPARPAPLFVGFIAAHLRKEFLTRASLLRSEPSCCRFYPGNTCFFVGFSPHGHDVWLHGRDSPPASAPAPLQMEQNTKREDAVLPLSKRPRNSLTLWIFFNKSLYFSLSPSATDQSHSASLSSENDAQGGDLAAWQQCTPSPSTSPSGEMPAHPPPSQQGPRPPRTRPASQSPTPPSALTGTKKRGSKPVHMRRNIRYVGRSVQETQPHLNRASSLNLISLHQVTLLKSQIQPNKISLLLEGPVCSI